MSDTGPDPPDPTDDKHETRWRPGQSGNPAGRAKGVRNRVLLALDTIGQEGAEAALAAVVRAAAGGDIRAAEVLLSRCWPASKGRTITMDLPPVTTAADLPAAIAAVLAATSGGEIAPEEGAALVALIEAQRRAIETADLEARIAALEGAKDDNSH